MPDYDLRAGCCSTDPALSAGVAGTAGDRRGCGRGRSAGGDGELGQPGQRRQRLASEPECGEAGQVRELLQFTGRVGRHHRHQLLWGDPAAVIPHHHFLQPAVLQPHLFTALSRAIMSIQSYPSGQQSKHALSVRLAGRPPGKVARPGIDTPILPGNTRLTHPSVGRSKQKKNVPIHDHTVLI